MADESKPSKALDDLLEAFLAESGDRYKTFHISGGEPMLDIGMLEEILSVILSHNQDADIKLYTNGCYLTEDIAVALNSYPNIEVNVSIDRLVDGERGLLKLLDKDYRGGYLNLKAIMKLNNKIIRSVLTREDFRSFSLAFELLAINRFFRCKMYIDHDWSASNLNEFNLDDVYNVGEFIFRLEQLSAPGDAISFNKLFTHPCQGECSDIFKWDGQVIQGCHLQSVSGCQKLREKMKPGIYDLLCQFVNFKTFKFDSKLEDKPRYDGTTGYIGERKTFIPERKQLQYEDRVNIRFHKEIMFKEIT